MKTLKPAAAKNLFFGLLLILIPVIFFVVIESILRLVNFGFSTQLLMPVENDNRYLTPSKDLGRKYFPQEQISPFVSPDFLLAEKPENSYRIFVFGGSTAAGYPYHFNARFSSILKNLLNKSYPNRFFEVVNFSMTAVNSYTVADLVNRCWEYKPDMLLIYSGHNEFYGALGVGSTESISNSHALIKTYLYLNDYKTFQFLAYIINQFTRLFREHPIEEYTERTTLMERMVKNKKIRYGSNLYQKSLRYFEKNIEEVIRESQSRGVKIVLSTITSNVRDQKPFADDISGKAPAGLWQSLIDKANQNFQQGNIDSAEYYYQKCLEIDSLTASPHFGSAQIFEERKNYTKSFHHFYVAKDFDALRFRASEDLNQVIIRLSDHYNLPLADTKTDFEQDSPHQTPGNNLFLEHLHPNTSGYYLMAITFYRTLVNYNLLPSDNLKIVPDEFDSADFGVTTLDEEIGNLRVKVLTSGWPFKNKKIGGLKNIDLSGGTIIQNLAVKYWKNEISWEEAHVQLAEYYEKNRMWTMAQKEFQALLLATPYNPSPYYRLVYVLSEDEKYDKAISVMQDLLQFDNNILNYKIIAENYLKKKEPAKALIYLNYALKLDKKDSQILRLLALSYRESGDTLNSKKIITYYIRQTEGK
jgi:tetratricopeptide (TPR) repeat protein